MMLWNLKLTGSMGISRRSQLKGHTSHPKASFSVNRPIRVFVQAAVQCSAVEIPERWGSQEGDGRGPRRGVWATQEWTKYIKKNHEIDTIAVQFSSEPEPNRNRNLKFQESQPNKKKSNSVLVLLKMKSRTAGSRVEPESIK